MSLIGQGGLGSPGSDRSYPDRQVSKDAKTMQMVGIMQWNNTETERRRIMAKTAEKTAKAKLADWIDADVIADAILEQLQEQGKKLNFENGKRVWLDFLETELSDGLENTIIALIQKNEI